MRKLATFEIIDGDIINDAFWEYEEEEDVDFYLQNSGYDSN